MNNFVKAVEGMLFGERLHEVFQSLAEELTAFVVMLRQKSLEGGGECTGSTVPHAIA